MLFRSLPKRAFSLTPSRGLKHPRARLEDDARVVGARGKASSRLGGFVDERELDGERRSSAEETGGDGQGCDACAHDYEVGW